MKHRMHRIADDLDGERWVVDMLARFDGDLWVYCTLRYWR